MYIPQAIIQDEMIPEFKSALLKCDAENVLVLANKTLELDKPYLFELCYESIKKFNSKDSLLVFICNVFKIAALRDRFYVFKLILNDKKTLNSNSTFFKEALTYCYYNPEIIFLLSSNIKKRKNKNIVYVQIINLICNLEFDFNENNDEYQYFFNIQKSLNTLMNVFLF